MAVQRRASDAKAFTVGCLYWIWCLVVCPLIGFLAGTLPFRNDPGLAMIILLSGGLPALLIVVGGVAARRRVAEILGAILATVLVAGILWVLYVMALGAAGVFD